MRKVDRYLIFYKYIFYLKFCEHGKTNFWSIQIHVSLKNRFNPKLALFFWAGPPGQPPLLTVRVARTSCHHVPLRPTRSRQAPTTARLLSLVPADPSAPFSFCISPSNKVLLRPPLPLNRARWWPPPPSLPHSDQAPKWVRTTFLRLPGNTSSQETHWVTGNVTFPSWLVNSVADAIIVDSSLPVSVSSNSHFLEELHGAADLADPSSPTGDARRSPPPRRHPPSPPPHRGQLGPSHLHPSLFYPELQRGPTELTGSMDEHPAASSTVERHRTSRTPSPSPPPCRPATSMRVQPCHLAWRDACGSLKLTLPIMLHKGHLWVVVGHATAAISSIVTGSVRAHAPHRARHETAVLGLLSEPGHQSREAAALGRVAAHYYSFFSFWILLLV
jgi:hypothetical protein